MASIDATFEDKRLRKFLQDITNNVKKYKECNKTFFSFASARVYRDIVEHFENEQGPNGKWKERSPKYKKKVESKGYTKILQVTGALKGSILPINAGKNMRVKKGEILWYSKLKYAHRHDQGTNGMPQRSFMWLSDKALDFITKVTLEEILK